MEPIGTIVIAGLRALIELSVMEEKEAKPAIFYVTDSRADRHFGGAQHADVKFSIHFRNPRRGKIAKVAAAYERPHDRGHTV